MKEYAPGSKSALIQSALRERYPNGVAETGSWTQLANEFGATRELVRRVAASLGIKRRKKVRMVRVCSSCGKCVTGQSGRPSMFCVDCVKIPLACDECGEIRREYAHEVLRRFNDEYNSKRVARGQRVYSGHYFCSRACFGKRAGREHGWGNPEHPHNAHKGEHGRVSQYRQGCRCSPCREASSAYYKKLYATNPEHRARILARAKERYARLKEERAAARA